MLMKNLISTLFLSSVLLGTSSAFAHEVPNYKKVQGATESALAVFESDETGALLKQIIGAKSWVETSGIKAKIYLKDGTLFLYSCVEQEVEEVVSFVCTKQ